METDPGHDPDDLLRQREISLFDKTTGLVAFALITLSTGFVLLANPEIKNPYIVTIYIGILSGIISTSLIGGYFRLSTTIKGLGLRAGGGVAVFLFVLWLAPGNAIAPPRPNSFNQSYGRLFGAMEVPGLLRLMNEANGSEFSSETILEAVKGQTSDELLRAQILASGCKPNDYGHPAEAEPTLDQIVSAKCYFIIGTDLIRGFAQKWPYLTARVIRTPLFKALVEDSLESDPGLPVALTYTAAADSHRNIECAIWDISFGPDPKQRDQSRGLECDVFPSRNVGFLYLTLNNSSNYTFDHVTIKARVFQTPAVVSVAPSLSTLLNVSNNIERNARMRMDVHGNTPCNDISSPACADAMEEEKANYYLFHIPLLEKDAAKLTFDDISCFREPCSPSTEYIVNEIRPNDVIFLLLAAYKARDDGFEEFYMSDVTVPLSINYSIGEQQFEQAIAPPLREKAIATRIEFNGIRGWRGQ